MSSLLRTKSVADLQATLAEAEGVHGLKRTLSAFDLVMLGIGAVIGAGIFSAIGTAAVGEVAADGTVTRYGAGPALVLSFLLLGAVCALAGLCYAELTSMIPIAGSAYTYAYATLGEIVAWIIGWDLILEYAVGNAAVAVAWSDYFTSFLRVFGIRFPYWLATSYRDVAIAYPQRLGELPVLFGHHVAINVPGMVIVAVITWVLVIGIKESARVNNAMVILKLAVLALFVGVGSFYIDPRNWTPFAPNGWTGIHQGAAIVFFAYIGFDAVSTAAEETKNPKKDVPLGLMLCLGVVIILYVSVAFVLTGIVPYKLIDVGNALPASLARIGIQWGGAIVATGAIIGMISTLLVTLYGQIRIFMVMARDGLLPSAFAKVHPTHKTPHLCTWITGIATAAIAGLFPLPMIIDLCNIGTLFAFVLVSVGVILLRRTRPEVERKFRTPGVPFTPLVTVAFCFYLMYSLPKVTWIRFGVWLLAGLLIYFLYSVRHSKLQHPAGQA